MGKSIRKWVAGLLVLSMIFGTVGAEWVPILHAASDSSYKAMANLERDFAGYLFDDASTSISASSVLKGDADVDTLERANDYKTGGYTSMTDYLYSFNSSNELIRDEDYSTYKNGKTGLLYYNKPLTDFELTFQYKHSAEARSGWNGIYVGMGASTKGKVWANESGNFAMFLQRTEHHAVNGNTTNISSLETGRVNYAATIDKYNKDNSAWFSYKLVVEGQTATWYIDNNQIASYNIANYDGGYIYLGATSYKAAFKNIAVIDKTNPYSSMAGVERDFTAAFYDDASTNLSTSSTILTDVTKLENYQKYYVSGGHTSLADYLFSVDGDGALFRDNDYGTSGNRKNGFLYFNKELKDFTLEMEYCHSVATSGTGWKSIYVGFGAQEVGNTHLSDQYATAIRVQPKEMYLEKNTVIQNYSNNADYKNTIAEKYDADEKAGTASWYTFKLTVKNDVATWTIDGKQFQRNLTDYIGGHLYISAMTKDTAFRNIKITEEKTTDYSAYDVYYPTDYSKNILNLTGIQKTDFENCWSLEEGTFTRVGTGNYAGGSSNSYGASMLYFNEKQYDAFEMEFDYSFGNASTGWKWMAIGFGADAPGRSYIDGDGYLTYVEQEGYVSYIHPTPSNGKLYSGSRITSEVVTEYQDTVQGVANAKWHHAKIKVGSGYLTISYDNQPEVSVPIKDYDGYVYLCCFTPTMQFKNVSITEVEDTPSAFESQFTAYYLPNGTNANKDFVPLKAANKVSDVWEVFDETVTRKGTGEYAPGPSGVQGASMLYLNDKYTNFELTFDYSFNGTTSGWKWIGAGFGASEKGKYYGDGDGLFAFVEQEGYRSLYQGKTSSRIGTKEIADYKSAVTGGDNTWHTYKLIVKGKKVSIYLDNYEVTETTIKGYEGGYVYLFGATPDMTIKNISIKQVEHIIPELQKQFTAYYLPNGTGANKDFVPLKAADVDDLWIVTEDTLTRAGTGEYAAGPGGTQGASMLYLNDKYTNFELVFDYSFNGNTAGWKWIGAGFGASEKGKYYGDDDGLFAFVEQEGYRSLYQGTTSSRIGAKEIADYKSTVAGGDNTWHTYKLVVKGKKVSIYLDNYVVAETTIKGYEGGYVYLFGATPGMSVRNINIKEVEYKIPELQKQFKAYYLPNGTNANKDFVPLKAADVDELWIVTEDTLTRAGTGECAAGPSGTQGASMLYFDQKYTNFSLSYDFTFAGNKDTWKWIGAGFGASEPGKYFGDDNGLFAFVEQEGYRSLYEGKVSQRIDNMLDSYYELTQAGDSTWHNLTIVVKGNILEVYLDQYAVTKTTLQNYKGGYVYLFGATPGMQMKNIKIEEITYIASVQELNNITTQGGTQSSKLGLPTSIQVTLSNGKTVKLPVTWNTEDYDANTTGKYVIPGWIDITGTNVYTKDSGRNVNVIVTVADFDTSKVKNYDFNSEKQVNDTFISYYVGADNKLSATSVLKKADASLTWTPTENGGIRRAGNGDYRPSTTQNLAGSLLYFKDKYTEFELDFDYTFNGVVKGWRWMGVGVGATDYGKTAYHTDNGTLAVVEMEGQIRTFTNNTPTLITDKNAFAGYAETLSEEALSAMTVHHMRVAVKNARMYIFVDDYPAADVALNSYNGGYVYLYGFTENLEISNIRMSTIVSGEVAQEVPYKSVQIGTALSEIKLPDALKVRVNGKVVNVPVEWSSPDYDSSKEGTYNFFATPIGKYSHLWFSNDAKRLQASVTVGNTDEDVVQKFAFTSTEELEAYFENYYVESEYELFDKKHWTQTYAGNTWKVSSEGVLKRTGKASYGGGAKGTYGVAALYYKDKLENFEIEFDYRHGDSGWKWVTVMFGADEIGATYGENGYLAFVEQEGKVRVQGSTKGEKMNFMDPFPASRYMDGYNEERQAIQKGESDKWFNYRLVVTNGMARVYINDELWSCSLADDYDGGYVALSLNAANTTIKNLSITNYDAKEIVIASIQDTKSVNADYIEIDKTKGDTLSLPDELEVTDINGYTYRLQIDWVNKDYRSGKLGTYKFTGNPILPSKLFKNPNKVAASSTVKVKKVDYNPATTVKYYFDNANDMLDFTEYYSVNTAETDLKENDWKEHWTLNNGQLQRINDSFSNPTNDKFGTYRKMSRLTYNKELKGNYQIDVDYQQDTGTYMWAMICFSTSDKTQFVVNYNSKEDRFEPNPLGGTAVYLEKEGSVNFWGNMDNTNLDGNRLRLLETAEKFDGYDYAKMHHMTVTVINGVARVYIDDYETNVAVRIPDEALGGYVSLMSNSNAVTFDNFSITQLDDDFEDGNVIKSGDTSDVTFVHQVKAEVSNDISEEKNVLAIAIPTLTSATAGIAVIALYVVSNRKKKEEEE